MLLLECALLLLLLLLLECAVMLLLRDFEARGSGPADARRGVFSFSGGGPPLRSPPLRSPRALSRPTDAATSALRWLLLLLLASGLASSPPP